MRAGTENIASIVGMAAALKKCVDGLKDTAEHLTRLETKLNWACQSECTIFQKWELHTYPREHQSLFPRLQW